MTPPAHLAEIWESMRRLSVLLLFVALVAVAAPVRAKQYARTLTLREPLGYTWTDELVHRDVTIAEQAVAAKTFSLADPQGQPVPLQVRVLKGKPSAVSRVRLWWKATLPKDEAVRYRLTYRDDGRPGRRPAGGVTAGREGDRLVVSTGVAAVALPAFAKAFAKPIPLAKAPPPVFGVRIPPGDGPWLGTWQLEGPGQVRRVEATVEADGPVRAEVRLRYTFSNAEHQYEVAVEAVAGEPWFGLRETYRLGEGSRARFTLQAHLQPTEALWLPWYVGDGQPRPAYAIRREPLAGKVAGGAPFATLRPRWAERADTAQVCLAVGEGDGADRPAVGAVMVRPAEWVRPYEQFPQARALANGRGMAIGFPLVAGRRAWALLAGPVSRFDTKGELQGLVRRRADVPLDRVLATCVFAWDRDPNRPGPHVLTTASRLKQIRVDVAAVRDTPATRLIRQALASGSAEDRILAEFLAGRRRDLPTLRFSPGVILGRSYQDAFLAPGAYPRRLPEALAGADLASAGAAGSPAIALLGYVFTDPNFGWPRGGWDPGRADARATLLTVPAYAAAMMPDHPHAKRWMTRALEGLRADLRRVSPVAGRKPVHPDRLAGTLARALPVLRAAQNAGLADGFTWPEVREGLECLRNLHTPPDPRLGRRVLVPFGEQAGWSDAVGRLFGMAAAGVRASDAGLAAVWMGVYRAYYGDAGSGDLAADVLLTDPSLRAAPPGSTNWPSRAYEGFGAVLRSRADTPRETFVTLRCGGAAPHGRGDAMSLTVAGAGAPITPAWHAPADVFLPQEHMHNRVTLGEDENMDAAGRLLVLERSAAADVAVAEARTTHLRHMPHRPEEATRGTALARRRLDRSARYRRWVMLVKHPAGSVLEDYVVVRDEVSGAEPATLNLLVLARRVWRQGRRLRFEGQLAADALVYVASAAPEGVTLAEWGWPAGNRSAIIPPGFEPGRDTWRNGEVQQWVRVRGRPEATFLTVVYPYPKGGAEPTFEPVAGGRGVCVTLGRASETVYLAADPPKEAGGQAAVVRGGQRTVVVEKEVKPM